MYLVVALPAAGECVSVATVYLPSTTTPTSSKTSTSATNKPSSNTFMVKPRKHTAMNFG